ncbi:hypothetical protein [Klebsiella pneumoniae]|uniref:hypothetical protein n=1 Tax=Klebsiella pneumoniae TaxID=573 RepID=UPI001C3F8177|nr:hypothetical protein [Klebsiella pneumoniae]
MSWLSVVAYFFGGFFLANAIPHVVSGTIGRPFQSPFARPPGTGFSSSIINVIWGFFTIVVGYLLVCRVGDFQTEEYDRCHCSGRRLSPDRPLIGATPRRV